MTVKDLIGYLQGIPYDYEVIADDGRDGMESGSPIDGIVVMVNHNKICMAVGFEEDEEVDYGKKNDMVNNPPHYAGGTSIECIDSMLAVLGVRGTIDFCLGNAYKYLWRHKLKGNPSEDLDKARWYVDKANVLNNSYLFEQAIEDKIEAVAALQGLYQCIYNGNKALHKEDKKEDKEEEIDAILTTDDTHEILDCLENLTNGIDNEHYNADDHLKDIARIINSIDKGRSRIPNC